MSLWICFRMLAVILFVDIFHWQVTCTARSNASAPVQVEMGGCVIILVHVLCISLNTNEKDINGNFFTLINWNDTVQISLSVSSQFSMLLITRNKTESVSVALIVAFLTLKCQTTTYTLFQWKHKWDVKTWMIMNYVTWLTYILYKRNKIMWKETIRNVVKKCEAVGGKMCVCVCVCVRVQRENEMKAPLYIYHVCVCVWERESWFIFNPSQLWTEVVYQNK